MLLIDALRTHLIDEGLVRDPRTAGTLPPCWRSPKRGVPAPGEGTGVEVGNSLVVGILHAPGIPETQYNATYLRTDGVDIAIRSSNPPDALELDDQIRAALADKRAWTMGGLQIVESSLYRTLSLLKSDEQGYNWVCGYTFQRLVNPTS